MVHEDLPCSTSETPIYELPPSAKLVIKMLEYNGALIQKKIIQKSMLSTRTVRSALERLEEIDAVEENVYFGDARQNLYTLTDSVSDHTTETACPAD